ncbi:MAG: hypothetical protein HC846_01380 [Blastocatellia bacterium]|nr:hypothetical protein [Blastocatellia bacterium]
MEINQAEKEALTAFFHKFTKKEKEGWLNEALRLAKIVIRYQSLDRKWRFNRILGKNDFTKEVYDLCKEAACANPIIVAREPSRARPPSPYTLVRWSKNF